MALDLHFLLPVSRGRRKYDNEEPSTAYIYSNSFSIGFNGYVFIFEFGMTDSVRTSHVRSRIVMNPAHAEQLSKMLADAVDQHVSKYGPIKTEADSSYPAESCEALLQPAAAAEQSEIAENRGLRQANFRAPSTVPQ